MDIVMESFRMDARPDGDTDPASPDVHERGGVPVTGR